MYIHTVVSGDSIYSIARKYGVTMSRVIEDNQLDPGKTLVVGQDLVIRVPESTYTVQPGDTLWRIAQRNGLTLRQLYRRNPALGGESLIFPGQTLVLRYKQAPAAPLSVLGYAYPSVDQALLRATAPYLTVLSPFTYSVTEDGGLTPLEDQALIRLGEEGGAAPLLHISNLIEHEGFSGELVHPLLNNVGLQEKLMYRMRDLLDARDYRGIDVDFEYVLPEDAAAYARFIRRLRGRFGPEGYPVFVALVAKTSSDQQGALYEGHDYRLLGEAADHLLLMTYEWGYIYGPPMAVAPLPNVRQVVEYALTQIPAGKIWLGIPNYGYDWPLPFVQGTTKAVSLSNPGAVDLARRVGAEIQYDQTAQVPWFRYRDGDGVDHMVWFENARSIRAKLSLALEYGLQGVGYWNLMRPFPENWALLDALCEVRDF